MHGFLFVASEEEAAPWVVNLDGLVPDPSALGACVNPVARDSGFIKYTESSSSSMASFTFKTSQVWMESRLLSSHFEVSLVLT